MQHDTAQPFEYNCTHPKNNSSYTPYQVPALDKFIANKFLQLLAPGRSTFTFQTFAEREGSTAKAKILHGTLADLWPDLMQEQAAGAGVFVTVNETDGTGRSAENIISTAAVWLDLDGKLGFKADKPINYPAGIKPHISVKSSSDGQHDYFLTTADTFNPDLWKRVQSQAIDRHKPDGADPAVKDPGRVMRLPGSLHQKGTPYLVQLIEVSDHPRYTLAELSAAFPAAPARQKRRTSIELPMADDNYTYRLNSSITYARNCAAGTSEGSRHNTGKNVAINLIGNQIRPDQAEAIMLDYADLVGLPESEALKILQWAADKPFKSRLKAQRVNNRRTRTIEAVDIAKALGDMIEHLGGLLACPDGQFHLVQVTTGVGKTTEVAKLLRGLWRAWPETPDGRPIKIAYLVDSKDDAEDFRTYLKLDLPIYEGRNPDNCPQHELIAGYHAPASYCKSACPVKKAGRCAYYQHRGEVMNERLVIASKQAFLNDSEEIERFDIVIVDENISDHLYQQQTITREQLLTLQKAIELAELDPSGQTAAAEFVGGLLAEMNRTDTPGSRILRRKAPAIDTSKLDRMLQTPAGHWIKPPAFWGLLAGDGYTLRIEYGQIPQLHIATRKNGLIERLKARTVINLDATPIDDMLAEFKTQVFKRDVAQNYILYQDTRYKLSRLMWRQDRYKGEAIACSRSIVEGVEGKTCVFTFKDQAKDLAAALPSGAMLAIYGRDTRATNEFKDCDTLILTGLYTPNISAMQDLARVAGIDYRRYIQQLQDASIAQAVGRIRAVHRIKPANVFVLTNHPLKLEKKAKPLDQFLKTLNCSQQRSPEPALSEVISGTKQDSGTKIYRGDKPPGLLQTALQAVSDAFAKPPNSTREQLKVLIRQAISKHGFFAHDLVGMGTGTFTQSPPLNVGDISPAQYQRHIRHALADLELEENRVQVSPGVWVKVWGDEQAAIAFITEPAELEQAIAFVSTQYRDPIGHVDMQIQAARLEMRISIRDLMAERDYTRHNWAILLYRYSMAEKIKVISQKDLGELA